MYIIILSIIHHRYRRRERTVNEREMRRDSAGRKLELKTETYIQNGFFRFVVVTVATSAVSFEIGLKNLLASSPIAVQKSSLKFRWKISFVNAEDCKFEGAHK